tara:strand:+ start:5103 stop:6947 length:1845 start_codon:yes stop_codon:yes gene_type:complete
MSIKKFKYTQGSEFTFDNENYIGYYNVLDGKAYKNRDEQIIELQSKENISSIIELEDFFDRSIYSSLSLPYTLKEVLFQPNEIINKNSINFKIEQLYDNFKELYKFSKIQNPLLPGNFSKYAVLSTLPSTEKEIIWYDSNENILSGTQNFEPLSDLNPLLGSDKLILNLIKGDLTDNFTLFASVSNTIFTFELSANVNTFNLITSTNKIGLFEDLRFENIVSVDTNNKDTLFVSDSGNNSLYKINVNDIVNRNRNGNRNFVLTEVIGNSGLGDTNFNKIDRISVGDKSIFLYDRGDKIIKQYTNDLNLVKKYINNSLFDNNEFVNLTYNDYSNLLYILFKNYKVVVLEANQFNKVDEFEYDLNDFDDDEIPKKILFSENNSNIYYVTTNKRIYKYFTNTNNRLIGKLNITNNLKASENWEENFKYWQTPGSPVIDINWDAKPGGNNFDTIDITTFATDENFDRLISLTNDRFFEFQEDNDLVSFLNNENPQFIDLKNILIKDDYFNNISFNNLIYKFLFNVNLLGLEIGKQLELKYLDSFLTFDKFRNIIPENKNEIVSFENSNDFFIGVNETISTKVFNRVIENVYNYFENLVTLLNPEINNTRISPLTTVTF